MAERYITARGGASAAAQRGGAGQLRLGRGDGAHDEGEFGFDYGISAVPFHHLGRILPESAASHELRRKVSHLRTVPITGIHLWFDREITPLEHASLLDRNIQWMFQKSKILESKTLESKGANRCGQLHGTGGELVEKPAGDGARRDH